MTQSVLEVYQKYRKSTLVGLPEKILHFTITETLQMAISECFQEVTKHEFQCLTSNFQALSARKNCTFDLKKHTLTDFIHEIHTLTDIQRN